MDIKFKEFIVSLFLAESRWVHLSIFISIANNHNYDFPKLRITILEKAFILGSPKFYLRVSKAIPYSFIAILEIKLTAKTTK